MLALMLLFAEGVITGHLDKPAGVTAVTAIDRGGEAGVRFAGTIDPKTGRFTVAKLPAGKRYCLLIEAGDVRLEGVDLAVPASDFEEEQPLTKGDEKEIVKIAKALNKFENEINVLAVRGNCQHAAVVLDKRRTTPFYESKPGEMVWRLEVWRFEKPEESWLKSTEELGQVLYRERLMQVAFAKRTHVLDPKLGGIALTKEKPAIDVGEVTIPAAKAGVHLRD